MIIKYSLKNYYLLMAPVFVVVFVCLLFSDYLSAIFFIISGFAGMIGEIIFSMVWDLFSRRKFWIYLKHPIANQYSSWLDFIPWSLGGLLYLSFSRILPLNYIFLILALGLIAMFFEYLYGRVMFFIFGKDLWLYQHGTVGHPKVFWFFKKRNQGRLSLPAYPVFCLAAVYFLAIFKLLKSII